ncbi:hypothetical protein JL721_12294 [Aureococcus anophagefferens]|nr:hypothetical protein JL721_12294 [Aureococcus anophagefferens]
MRPILLKGHERSITCVIYNRDGDLIFTSAKDGRPTLWLSEAASAWGPTRLHNGAVWHLDVSWDSKLLVSGSADMHAKVWDVETGAELASFEHSGPVAVVLLRRAPRAAMCDAFGGLDVNRPPLVNIYENSPMFGDPSSWRRAAQFRLPHPEAGEVKCQIVRWMPLGKAILCAFEDGQIKIHDSLSFEEIKCVPAHDSKIHPTKEHVLVGGGQDAMSVTAASGRQGKFETQFFHLAYEEEFGRVKGHFGPINALAIAPDGRAAPRGGDIRLHLRRTS